MRLAILFSAVLFSTVAPPVAAVDPDGVYNDGGMIVSGHWRGEFFSTQTLTNGSSWTTAEASELPGYGEGEAYGGPGGPCLRTIDVPICKVNGQFRPAFKSARVRYLEAGYWLTESCSLTFTGSQIVATSSTSGRRTFSGDGCYVTVDQAKGQDFVLDLASRQVTGAAFASISRSGGSELPDVVCEASSRHIARDSYSLGLDTAVTFVGGPNPSYCSPPPFQTVALNPYWSYPQGAQTVDLSRIAREISAPGSSPGTLPSGRAIATGVVTDGVSRVIIGVRTRNIAQAITFSLMDEDPGRLAPLTPGLFSNPLPGTRSVIVNPFSIPGEGSAKAAAAVYVAPETPFNFPGRGSVRILVEQGSIQRTIVLVLEPPPLLLAHGIWGKPSAFGSEWDAHKETALGHRVAYPSSLGFNTPSVQSAFRTKVLTILQAARARGIVATQVDVVAHSMGGLVTRFYAGNTGKPLNWNFRAGYINRLIAIDTSHLGSNLAKFLWERQNLELRMTPGALAVYRAYPEARLLFLLLRVAFPSGSPTLADAMAFFDMPIGTFLPVDSAVETLVPGSAALGSLPTPSAFKYEVVAGWVNTPNALSWVGLEWVFNIIFCLIDACQTIDGQLTQLNDVIVALQSQLDGGWQNKVFAGVVHSNPGKRLGDVLTPGVLDSPKVVAYVACRLRNGSTCAPPPSTAETSLLSLSVLPDFSLNGRTQVAAANLDLTGIPASGLQLSNSYKGTFSSPTRSIQGLMYVIRHGDLWQEFNGSEDLTLTLKPTRLAPVLLIAIAAFTDNTYATRIWRFGVDPVVTPTFVDIPDDAIRLSPIGSIYQLQPVAYLAPPDQDILDISSLAIYSVLGSGSEIVRVDAGGSILALKQGIANVRVAFRGRSDTVKVIVGP